MLLAVDIGNTNIHLGLWNDNTWHLNWRMRTVLNKMPDEYAVLIGNFLRSAGFSWSDVTAVSIACVVPSLRSAFAEMTQRYANVTPLFVSAKVKTGIVVDADQPDQVGADRIANAVAAQALYGGPAIVVDFGTATNFDVVSHEGNYIGGSIAPGVGVAMDALVGRTAQLYKVTIEPPPSPVGRNTADCIQSGVFWGYIGLVEGLIMRIKNTMPYGQDAKVIATGGLAALFREHTTAIQEIAPFLTLDGLRIVYEYNQG